MLFAACRKVECDQSKREIRIKSRKWWFIIKSSSIPFSTIEYIDRDKYEMPSSFGFAPGGYGYHDTFEFINVCAVTNERHEMVPLFQFWGDGSENTGWTGVIFGDDVIDFHGDQENAAINFAQLIAKATGTRVGISREVIIPTNENGKKIYCVQCNHQLAPHVTRCIYCGSTEIKEES